MSDRVIEQPLLQTGVVQLFPWQVKKIVSIPLHQPAGANGIVVELVRFRCRVPALYDAIIGYSHRARIEELKPVPLDDLALGRNRALLVLSTEVEATESALELFENLSWFALFVKRVSHLALMKLIVSDLNPLFGLCNGGQIEMGPVLSRHHVAGQVVEVETLHDQDDDVVTLAVQARVEGAVEPIFDRGPLCFRHCPLRCDRIVSDNEISSPSC